ncbi:UPF0182 family protein [Nakamurella deserti]|uniref:UPF0182 family membrane protein n=1 Tax=Nakamurella deserti TaxID=2164074 RepID=UPI0023E78251|nr:UPF0182 family protein [Nakamurella deserti]
MQRPPINLPSMSRRSRRVIIALVSIAVLFVLWFNFVGIYVDYLWFSEVGFQAVFTTQLLSRIVLFLITGVLAGLIVFGAIVLAYRSRPVFVPTDEIDPLAPYRIAISGRPKLITIGISAIVGVVCGLSAQANWDTVQLWLNGTSFGTTDAQFGNDVGFYVFDLPLYELVLGWLFVIIAVAFFVVLIVQYLYGGIRTTGPGRKITSAASLQLSLLIGAFVLVKAVQYWFDRYALLFSNRSTVFTGASYTDVNAVLPAKLILMCIAAICAVGFFVGAFLRSVKLPAVALALLVLSGVLIGGAWPLILQSVRVTPNAITLEKEYIERNIAATRSAYGIGDDKVTYVPYNPPNTGSPASLVASNASVPNARLLDPTLLSPTWIQQQQNKNFYSFTSQLAVDRYTVNGETEDYIVAVREVDISKLAENQQNWINEHLVYTHGDGFVAAPASQVSGASTQVEGGAQGTGFPTYAVSDLANKGQGPIPVQEPFTRVYYGQLGADYSIVGAEPGQDGREYDTDSPGYTYTGSGGVDVGNLFKRLVFATQYGEPNFLFSTELNGASKIMYNRDPVERVEKAAPFLTTDTKPYPAVVDGRIVWIVDGYTTAANYPYAQNVSLNTATNSSQVAQGATAQVDERVSYIRNSVKATVDAYDGTVKLYGVDDTDPILKAWEGVFPDLIIPGDQASDDLKAHFRYPQDLFEVQRSLLAKYQVSDGTEFYQSSGFWQVPNDPTVDGTAASAAQPPYYLQLSLPGEETPSFQLTSALTGFQRQFMGGYISASSDPGNYGKITVLRFPGATTTPGPVQVQQVLRNNQDVSRNLTLIGLQNVRFGNLLTLPLDNGLLYIEPVYAQAQAAGGQSYPQLNLVLVWYGSRVGLGNSIETALENAAGSAVEPVPGDGGDGGGTSVPPTTDDGTGAPSTTPQVPANAEQALVEVQSALEEVKSAQTGGSFAEVGAAQDRLNTALSNYLNLVGAGTTPDGSAPTTEATETTEATTAAPTTTG